MNVKTGICAVIALAMLLFTTQAMAQASRDPSKIGVGLGAATVPAGISVKKNLGESVAAQGVVGAWRGYGRHYGIYSSAFGLGADLLMEQGPLGGGDLLSLGWNVGAGAGVGIASGGVIFGVTGVLGLEFNFVSAPFDIVAEYRPGLYLGAGYGDADIGWSFIDFTGHVRFWF